MVDWFKTLKVIGNIVIFLSITGFLASWTYLMWKDLGRRENIPYDDVSSHLESIECRGRSCNVTFDLPIRTFYEVPETGSMVPLIGGNDWVVCLDAKNVTINLGDYVITPYALHMIYEEEGDWYITKGFNNPGTDPYKISKDNIRCVIGAVFR